MNTYTRDELVTLLSSQGNDYEELRQRALEVKKSEIGNKIFLRGLIEYSNYCHKNCFYCGIRRDNKNVSRYQLTDDEVYRCADLAMELGYGSLAIQSGERSDAEFTNKIAELVFQIKKRSNNALGITLSCGEQSEEVYKQWFEAGAHRYLLRIETSNKDLYYKIHPQNQAHDFETRINALRSLIKVGYQTGTGVMIGLPFQTMEHLANDLLFFKNLNVAMVGMGPFIAHQDTPLWQYHTLIPDAETRVQLTLKMISALRLLMPKINIVASTANQTLFENGREQAVLAGANIIMPNLTAEQYREKYFIYPDKTNVGDSPIKYNFCLFDKMKSINHEIIYNKWGDSRAFTENITCSE